MGLLDFLQQKSQPQLFSGGRGESAETAVVINASDPSVGVAAEYSFLMHEYGPDESDWTMEDQAETSVSDRHYDVLTIKLKDGTTGTVWFDVTSFFKELRRIGAPPADA